MTAGKVFVSLGIFCLVCVGSVTGIYFAHLGNLPISSSDPTPWAQFGAYVGGVLGPIFALINLFIIVYIAIRVKEFQETQLSAKRISLDLYDEWHDETLHESRIAMDRLITDKKKKSEPIPTLTEFEGITHDNSKHAFRVYHFFEKWAVLDDARQIDNTLLFTLLAASGDAQTAARP